MNHPDRVTYQRLIADHDEIGRLCDAILALAAASAADASDIARVLARLVRLVEDHVEIESGIIERFSEIPMSAAWYDVWTRGAADFGRLCHDWDGFLKSWDEGRIAADRAAFLRAARAILTRLGARTAAETEALYASAVHFDLIALA